MAILRIDNLSKKYANIHALKGLSLKIEKGQVYGFLGPNGSGKTTTLAIILGVIKQTSGSYTWFEGQVPQANLRIGSVLETPFFFPYLTLLKNLQISALVKKIPENDMQEFERVLRTVNLWERKNSRFDTLSFGMRQRLALASALLGDPEVLLLDEPTNGLDPQGIVEFRDIINNEASKGKTILFASHILDEVEKICTHVAILKKGELLANGPVNEIHSLGKTRKEAENQEYLIISSNNNEQLIQVLMRSGLVKNVEKSGYDLKIECINPNTSAQINEFAFKNNITLNKLEIKKHSLEDHFLEIVNK